jgi:hypothetical protein
MRAIRRFSAALISLLLAAAPAAALDIAPALDGSSWESLAELNRNVLEFDDHDWALFICPDESEFLLPPLEAPNADFGADGLEGLLTQVWEHP